MSEEKLAFLVQRVTANRCENTSHDGYADLFCPECGRDAHREILAVLKEAHDMGRSEGVEHLRSVIVNWAIAETPDEVNKAEAALFAEAHK